MLKADAVQGCLLGQAIGDMMGLPYENLSPRRVNRLARLDKPRFLFGYGCGSDDTEHAALTAEALIHSQGDLLKFRSRLASSLRRWFLAVPPGIGLATAKACLKLSFGIPPNSSGVYSAGNGPAMRATVLGAMLPAEQLFDFNAVSTRLTHSDPRAEQGSLIIAKLANVAKVISPTDGPTWIEAQLQDKPELEPLTKNLRQAGVALRSGETVREFAQKLCGKRGVSGFIAHTVPVALMAFFRHHDNYKQAIEEVIRCGGDTDTVAAITGGLLGHRLGVEAIPQEWLSRHRDWPWSITRLRKLNRPSVLAWPMMFTRNLAFFGVAVAHIFLRLLPSW